jgi:hypothetical protein
MCLHNVTITVTVTEQGTGLCRSIIMPTTRAGAVSTPPTSAAGRKRAQSTTSNRGQKKKPKTSEEGTKESQVKRAIIGVSTTVVKFLFTHFLQQKDIRGARARGSGG